MSCSRSGLRPGKSWPVGMCALAVILAAAAGGCSSTRTAGTPSASWSSSEEASRLAYQAPPPKVEMEDDGMEAQVPPPTRIRQEPDDPSEPFSPNYGTRLPVRQAQGLRLPDATVLVPQQAGRAAGRLTVASGD